MGSSSAAPRNRSVLAGLFACFGASKGAVKEDASGQACTAGSCGLAQDLPAQLAKKAAGASGSGSGCARRSGSADGASSSCSAAIPALYEVPGRRSSAAAGAALDVLSCDAPSTSYPTTSLEEEWDVLGACMTTAQEMEACVDAVLDGSIKSAQTLFARYDMDLDQRLAQQDYYDLCLELALALPYQEYARFVEASFAYADSDADGRITLMDFVPLYKSVAAVRRAFRRQDHHNNGQIDGYDFYQLLVELSTSEEAQIGCQQQPLQGFAEAAFSLADTTGRGIINFGQTLVWYAMHLLSSAKHRQASSSQLLERS